jgi:thiaminase/transcriptional activator TenA
MSAAPGDPARARLSDELWAAASGIYLAILEHPFIAALGDGSLDRAAFRFYIAQDSLYLEGFERALWLLAERAPSEPVRELFRRHAAAVIAVETSLHAELLAELSDTAAEAPATRPTPATLAYTSYLVATCATEPFMDGVTAVLPCYWIYREVGRALLARSSPDPLYARWIATYGGEEFDQALEEILALTDSLGARLSASDRESAIDHFLTAARYEWMFWDAAHRREGWPI